MNWCKLKQGEKWKPHSATSVLKALTVLSQLTVITKKKVEYTPEWALKWMQQQICKRVYINVIYWLYILFSTMKMIIVAKLSPQPWDKPWTPQQHNHCILPKWHHSGCFNQIVCMSLSIILQSARELLRKCLGPWMHRGLFPALRKGSCKGEDDYPETHSSLGTARGHQEKWVMYLRCNSQKKSIRPHVDQWSMTPKNRVTLF